LPALQGATSYRVVIANDEKFNNIVRELKVPVGSPANLSGLANGNFYALVRGIDGIGLEGFNSVKLISVQDAPAPPVRDPWQPGGNKMINLNVADGKTFVSWNESPGDQTTGMRYAVMLGSDASMKDASISSETTERQVNLGELKPGTYFVQLRFTPASGKPMQSALYRFTLTDNWNQTVFSLLSALQLVKP
jgi:hypothetical protein